MDAIGLIPAVSIFTAGLTIAIGSIGPALGEARTAAYAASATLIDRFAAEGMRFTQGFTKPVCSPSRAMLLTGQYSHRLGIPDYIPYGNPVHAGNGLPAGTPTIASLLKGAGYATGDCDGEGRGDNVGPQDGTGFRNGAGGGNGGGNK